VIEPRFLSLDEILELHTMQLLNFGGGEGLRDAGALESAVAQPAAASDLFEVAAAYAFHIAQDQPFVDGNKRAGVFAALMFLELNGVAISDPDEHIADAMIAISERRMDKQGLASLLRKLRE
jgi:death-on-curing protein